MSNIPSREEVERELDQFTPRDMIAAQQQQYKVANRILKALWEEWNAANWRYADDPAEALDKAMHAAYALYEGKP